MELGGFPERWVDVFVSKAADDPTTRGLNPGESEFGTSYNYDDQFCCTVQSIEFDPDDTNGMAYITTNNSEWILPTWSHALDYGSAAAAASPYADLKVGDLVRIGGIPQEGFTDYLTVVEIRKVTYLTNATAVDVSFTDTQKSLSSSFIKSDNSGDKFMAPSYTDTSTYSTPGTTRGSGTDETNDRLTLSTNGIAHIAIRVNAALNCTTLPDNTLNRGDTEQGHHVTHLQNADGYPKSKKNATLERRQFAHEYMTYYNDAYTAGDEHEKFYYPLYRAKNWTHGKELVARLDRIARFTDPLVPITSTVRDTER